MEHDFLLRANRDELEKLLTMEQGKPLSLSNTELTTALAFLRTFAGMEVKDEVLKEDDDKIIYATFPPIGVCAGIVPWNWPVLLGMGKLGPALITGNVFIMKPSPYTPYCDLKLGELAAQVFPPGVVQTLSGDDNLGPWITSHLGIDKVSFTGSIATGKLVAASCAKTLKRCTLELGGELAVNFVARVSTRLGHIGSLFSSRQSPSHILSSFGSLTILHSQATTQPSYVMMLKLTSVCPRSQH